MNHIPKETIKERKWNRTQNLKIDLGFQTKQPHETNSKSGKSKLLKQILVTNSYITRIKKRNVKMSLGFCLITYFRYKIRKRLLQIKKHRRMNQENRRRNWRRWRRRKKIEEIWNGDEKREEGVERKWNVRERVKLRKWEMSFVPNL